MKKIIIFRILIHFKEIRIRNYAPLWGLVSRSNFDVFLVLLGLRVMDLPSGSDEEGREEDDDQCPEDHRNHN